MNKKSAGIILYRKQHDVFEVMLVHPGGPFWAKKDSGVWSIPKGEFDDDEEALAAAKREFKEELGKKILSKKFIELSPVKSKSNKTVYAFAAEEDFDETDIKSNTCWVDWPPRSGKRLEIFEVDKAGWFDFETAKKKILPYQIPLVDELMNLLKEM